MRLQSDLFDVLEAAADGRLSELEPLQWDERPGLDAWQARVIPAATTRATKSAESTTQMPWKTSGISRWNDNRRWSSIDQRRSRAGVTVLK